MKILYFVIVVSAFLVGCKSEYSNRQLAGRWVAISLTEENVAVAADLSQVWMEFTEKGGYKFHSTLNIVEEGRFRLHRKLLVRQNVAVPDEPEKAVELVWVHRDSMMIGMREGEKTRLLTMKRSK